MSLPNSNTLANLGGELGDYSPPVDPTTDLPAAADNDARADTAAMTRMIGRCYLTFTDALVVVEHDSVWGNANSVKPVPTKIGTGHYTVTWPTTVTDELGVTRALNLRRAAACCEDSGYSVSAIRTGPNTADVFVWILSATPALGDPPNNVNVWAW